MKAQSLVGKIIYSIDWYGQESNTFGITFEDSTYLEVSGETFTELNGDELVGLLMYINGRTEGQDDT